MSKYADIQIKQKQEILTCIAGLSSNPEFNIGGEKFLEVSCRWTVINARRPAEIPCNRRL